MASEEFEIDGVRFSLESLKLEKALKGEVILLQGLLPALRAGGEFDISGIAKMPEMFALFLERCKVKLENGTWVPLSSCADSIFERKSALRIAWLLRCVRSEYGDFLSGTGLDIVKSEVESFGSLIG